MHGHAQTVFARAGVHVGQEHTHGGGVEELEQVAVEQAEQKSREQNGGKVAVAAGAVDEEFAEQKLLAQGGADAGAEEGRPQGGLLHNGVQGVGVVVVQHLREDGHDDVAQDPASVHEAKAHDQKEDPMPTMEHGLVHRGAVSEIIAVVGGGGDPTEQ